jgi:putative membrane protein insertion efficiency factor
MFKAADHLIRNFVILLVNLYQKIVSPFTPPSCRFTPTCSEYSKEAFKKYNPFKAFLLSIYRIVRCNPFSKGGYDPLK